MSKTTVPITPSAGFGWPASPDESADPNGVVARRKRFLEHARAARKVAAYRFKIEADDVVHSLEGGTLVNARGQLTMIVAMTGGAIAKRGHELIVRAPIAKAGQFEALAWPLIERFMVSFQRGELDVAPTGD